MRIIPRKKELKETLKIQLDNAPFRCRICVDPWLHSNGVFLYHKLTLSLMKLPLKSHLDQKTWQNKHQNTQYITKNKMGKENHESQTHSAAQQINTNSINTTTKKEIPQNKYTEKERAIEEITSRRARS